MRYLTVSCYLVSLISLTTSVFCPLKWPSCGLVIQNIVCERGGSCPALEGCESVEIDPEFRKFLLQEHNRLRNEIATGKDTRGYTGPAANMMALSYDRDLEFTALCNANRCTFQHDKCRGTKKFPRAGQNLFYATGELSDLRSAVTEWFEEIKLNTPEVIDKFPKGREDISNFTQTIWATTTHIGCAISRKIATNEYYLVCNYGPEGNQPDQKVYERGDPCSKCPNSTQCSQEYPGLCVTENDDIEAKIIEKDRPPMAVMNQFGFLRGDNPLPDLPTIPALPKLPESLPALPNLPALPTLSGSIETVPTGLPDLPALPSVLPNISDILPNISLPTNVSFPNVTKIGDEIAEKITDLEAAGGEAGKGAAPGAPGGIPGGLGGLGVPGVNLPSLLGEGGKSPDQNNDDKSKESSEKETTTVLTTTVNDKSSVRTTELPSTTQSTASTGSTVTTSTVTTESSTVTSTVSSTTNFTTDYTTTIEHNSAIVQNPGYKLLLCCFVTLIYVFC